ncbi:Type 11 methyltransferase [Seminavis robusta]|uniref:Type 11 methyltransferase n=1 Tax=Seminavis robusta TaxID=568900 RepID=A0A9N8EWE5_9STRA|nr:Type 11 methyltransferase [Seminavis robusta]|eukprot:Sro2019_g311290.1 Type 11 methyltransferase (154) ;mRNA; f:3837-4298
MHLELAKLPYEKKLAGLDLAPGMKRRTQQRLQGQEESDLRIGDVTKGPLPWNKESFDYVLSTFVFSAISNDKAAIDEMVKVLKPGGKLIIVDAGVAQNRNVMSRFLAWLWEVMGDYMRDETQLLSLRDDIESVTREDYGPWGCVHVTVGEKKK